MGEKRDAAGFWDRISSAVVDTSSTADPSPPANIPSNHDPVAQENRYRPAVAPGMPPRRPKPTSANQTEEAVQAPVPESSQLAGLPSTKLELRLGSEVVLRVDIEPDTADEAVDPLVYRYRLVAEQTPELLAALAQVEYLARVPAYDRKMAGDNPDRDRQRSPLASPGNSRVARPTRPSEMGGAASALAETLPTRATIPPVVKEHDRSPPDRPPDHAQIPPSLRSYPTQPGAIEGTIRLAGFEPEHLTAIARKQVADTQSLPLIGIDYGSATLKAARVRGGLERLPVGGHSGLDDDSCYYLPTLVAFRNADNIRFGHQALNVLRKNSYGEAPSWAALAPKRFIEEERILEGAGFSAEEASTLILKRARSALSDYLEEEVHSALFTLPSSYADDERQHFRKRVIKAGFTDSELISHASAILLAHRMRGRNGLAAIYDFGVGFEFTVIEIRGNLLQTRVSATHSGLGGYALDSALIEALAETIPKKGDALLAPPHDYNELRIACDQLKRGLRERPNLSLELEDETTVMMGRERMREIALPQIDSALDLAEIALGEAGLAYGDIDRIVLAGGGAVLPGLRDRVATRIGHRPVVGDAEFSAVRGAALRAAELSSRRVHQVAARRV